MVPQATVLFVCLMAFLGLTNAEKYNKKYRHHHEKKCIFSTKLTFVEPS